MMIYLLLLVNVLLLVSGQMLWKIGVSSINHWGVETVFYLIRSPFIIGGGLLYVIATFIWLYIISKIPFSIAYPIQSLSYALGVIMAYLFFKEQVNITQWIGIAVIVLGVYLIAK